MTEKEYLEFLEKMNKAEESVVPFAVPTEDEIVVVGDPNEIELNTHDFKIWFRIPRIKDGKRYLERQEIEYNDVFINGMTDPKVLRVMNEIWPFYKKVTKNGKVENFTDEEIMDIIDHFSDDLTLKMYDLVATVLEVDERLKPFMEYGSVMEAVGLIFSQYPEMLNESSTFFPSASNGRTTTRPQ